MPPQTNQTGFELAELQPGGKRTMLSATVANQLIRRINALCRLKVQRGETDAVFLSDSNAVIQIAAEVAAAASGGASVQIYQISSISDIASDYIAAQPCNIDNSNTVTLGSAVNVAVPWQLRTSVAAYVSPPYAAGDYIIVSTTTDGTGVVVSGSQLQLADIGVGRTVQPVSRWRVKTVYGDYYDCKSWDGTTEGSTTVHIAKPPKLRHSSTSEVIEGTTVSYSYSARTNNNDGSRAASGGGYSETQIVLPVWITNDEIFAAKPGA